MENGLLPSRLWFKETNTVVYDPQRISIDEMESTLKEAGTYQGILEPKE